MRLIETYSNLRLRTKLVMAGLAVSIVVFIVLSSYSYSIYYSSDKISRKVESSYRLVNTVESICFHFLHAENCFRHHIEDSTNQEHLINLYGRIQQDLALLERLISGSTVQKSNLEELERLIKERGSVILAPADISHKTSVPFNKLTADDATANIQYAGRIRSVADRIKQVEYAYLENRELATVKDRQTFYYLSLLASGSTILLTLVIFGVLLKDEKDIRRREKNLTDLNLNKDNFFSIVSHDLRGPASNLVKLSEFLLEENLGSEDRKVITSHLNSSAQSLHKLLDNLLSWSRLQMGRIEIKPVVIDLHQLAQESIAQVANAAADKKVAIENTVEPGTSAYADEKMCNTILRNLLQNAIKFTYPSGSIRIHSQITRDFVELLVSDTGVGMTPETVSKLFQLGTHFTSKGTANEQGSGLGLILCQEMVEKNNGKISVTSELKKGSTFTISLPKAAPAA